MEQSETHSKSQASLGYKMKHFIKPNETKTRVGDVSPSVKYLLYNHEDLCKQSGMAEYVSEYACNPREAEP